MMWSVEGTPQPAELFGRLEPIDVFIWHDGPRTFTLRDADGGLCLAHWLDEGEEIWRYVVVPITQSTLNRLTGGELTLSDGLDQPRVYIADEGGRGEIRTVWLTALAAIPERVLPAPGTMIHPDLEPLFRLTARGARIRPGETPGSVVRSTVEAAQKSFKVLAEHETQAGGRAGRPTRSLQRFYDLPAQYMRAASFEVAFRSPLGDPGLFDGLSDEDKVQVTAVLEAIGRHLRTGLEWLTAGRGDSPVLPVPGDVDLSRAIVRAMKLLTPTPQSVVETLDIGGQLVRHPAKPFRVTKQHRLFVNAAASRLPVVRESHVILRGHVRELDADRLQFRLRDLADDTSAGRVCQFEADLWDDVYDLLGVNARVEVSGRETSPISVVNITDFSLAADG